MTFGEALDLMRKGRVVNRRAHPSFAVNGGIAICHGKKLTTLRRVHQDKWYVVVIHNPSNVDILACDWEVVDATAPIDENDIFRSSPAES